MTQSARGAAWHSRTRSLLLAAVGGLLVALSGCSGSPAELTEDRLAEARTRWVDNAPDVYRVRYEGGGVSASVFVDRDVPDADGQHRYAIDSLFTELEARIIGGESVRAAFDDELGYPIEIEADGLTVASKLFDGGIRITGCAAASPGSAIDVGSESAERVISAELYDRWQDDSGCPVRTDVITTFDGSAHCGWEPIQYLVVGSPIGTAVTPESALHYIRDTYDVIGSFDNIDRGRLVSIDELPATVADSGYRLEDSSLWFDAADDSVAYLVSERVAEEFVLDAAQVIACD